jgi:serine/threonine protein kinase
VGKYLIIFFNFLILKFLYWDYYKSSPEYMAPEIVTREGHSYAVDYYTLGALLHELVVGLPPFYSRDPDEMMDNILN